MTPSLQSLARDCKAVLQQRDTPEGRSEVASLLARALRDPVFLKEQFEGAAVPERKVVYEDPELGFCILVHEYRDAREGGRTTTARGGRSTAKPKARPR